MTEVQVDEVVSRASSGEAVESALRSMGLDLNISTEELKAHPSAKGRIKAAKGQLLASRAFAAAQSLK